MSAATASASGRHADEGAAQLSLFEFANAAMASVFLLNRRYMPYYKWRFRALRGLSRLSETADVFEFLISHGNSAEEFAKKCELTDFVCSKLADELLSSGLIEKKSVELESCAYSVNEKIADPELRNMNIFAAV